MSNRSSHLTRTSNNSMLQIELDNQNPVQLYYLRKHPTYKPGDTISGYVYRTAPVSGVIPLTTTITVTLIGHSTANIETNTGRYESSFDIFDGRVETLVLHSSEARLQRPDESDGLCWPFAFTIPFSVRDVRDYMRHSTGFYSSPDGSEGPTFVPPGSFSLAESVADCCSGRGEASIKYSVEAKMELVFNDEGRGTFKVSHTATAPFQIENLSFSEPIANFGSKIETMQRGVYSYKLVPGIEGLTLAQRARKALMSSSVPRFATRVSVSLPVFLQIGNPNPIPVTVAFEPIASSTSEILHDVPQTLTITVLSIQLRPKTTMRADKTVASLNDSKTVTKTGMWISILPFTAIRDLRAVHDQEVSVVITPGPVGTCTELLELGAILDFRLHENLHPSFETYNIARSWELGCEMEVSVAGEKFRVGSTRNVVVLPRAYEGPVPVREGTGGASARGRGEMLPEYEKDEELPPYSG
ncbi:hypothetical protein BJX63DRAFT_436315 [Aspergillus granulosus]|uniref:Arrestin-like N-terminal domain-containing protein n=1 Tax=Aspergillus granulosus TaxID=176169 RepID=A0ABR4GYX4_9EURO